MSRWEKDTNREWFEWTKTDIQDGWCEDEERRKPIFRIRPKGNRTRQYRKERKIKHIGPKRTVRMVWMTPISRSDNSSVNTDKIEEKESFETARTIFVYGKPEPTQGFFDNDLHDGLRWFTYNHDNSRETSWEMIRITINGMRKKEAEQRDGTDQSENAKSEDCRIINSPTPKETGSAENHWKEPIIQRSVQRIKDQTNSSI